MVRNSVVLPAPFRPIRPANSPFATSRFTPRRIATGPMETDMPSSRSMRNLLTDHVAAHVGHPQDGLRRAIADDAAVVEGDHAPGEPRHDIHVVLDKDYRDASGARRAHHHIH